MRNPTMIADYSKLSPYGHKKFDYNFTSLPGDDAPPIKTGADMFPKGVVRDTFEKPVRKQPQSMSDTGKAPTQSAPAQQTAGAHAPRKPKARLSHCIIS